MFRQSHEERQQLINQWEQIINQMRKRDEDMDRTATVRATHQTTCATQLLVTIVPQELARLKAEIKTKDSVIQEKQVPTVHGCSIISEYLILCNAPLVVPRSFWSRRNRTMERLRRN